MSTITGTNQADTLTGTTASDTINGGNGDDTLDGGGGGDSLYGGNGKDVLIYVASENIGSTDFYDGGNGKDTLRLILTSAQYAAAASEIQQFQALLAGGKTPPFTFTQFGLTTVNIEHLELVVVPDSNHAPTANAVEGIGDEDAGPIAIMLTATDPDAGDSVESFTLSSLPMHGLLYTDAAMTQLAATGVDYATTTGTLTLYFKPNADFNGDASFSYTASDGQASSAAATATIHVTAVNDSPTGIALDNDKVVEGKAGFVVGTLTVSDPDFGDTHTFTVSDNRFEVDGNTLRLKDGIAIDFEDARANFEIQVTATDAGNASVTQTFTIHVLHVSTGSVVDGYIAGATVFADDNENGVLDPGEASTTTDANGSFTLVGGSGPLVMEGGIDIWTGLAFDGVMRAPAGSTVITPLTTLVASIAGANATPAEITEANVQVLAALGLDPSLNLRTLDPIAAALSADPVAAELGGDALAAAIQLQNTIDQAAALLTGAGANAEDAAAAVLAALAAQIEDVGALDLADAATVTAVLDAAATAVSTDIGATAADATAIITAGNQEAAAADGLTGSALLTELAQIASVAQGEAADALATGDTGAIADFVDNSVAPDGSLEDTVVEAAPIGVNLDGANGPDTLTGSGDDETFNGYGGDDEINAAAGSDVLIGGTGNDILFGGAGDDTYYFARVNGQSAGVDTIHEESGVGSGTDVLRIFTIGPEVVATRSGNDLSISWGLLGDQVTVVDQYNGHPVEYVAFPTFGTVPVWVPLFTYAIDSIDLSQPVFLVGGDGDETITGGSKGDFLFGNLGNDILLAGDGDDVLYGGVGDDTLNGGAVDGLSWGADFANYADSPSAVTVNFATGIASDGWGDTDTLISIEAVIGSAHDDTLTGSNNASFFSERFLGGAGNDTINGQGGFDFLQYNGSPSAVTVNLGSTYTLASVTYTGFTAHDGFGDIDSLNLLEGVRGSGFDDILIGSDRTDTTEQFRGNPGNDTIDGRGGNDMVDFIQTGAGITVDLTDTYNLAVGGYAFDGYGVGFRDTLFNIENVRASMFDDVLIGSSASNSFQGLAGDDLMNGAGGIDTADYSLDAVVQGFLGITVNLATGTATDGSGDTDTLISIENVTGNSLEDQGDVITGSSASNTIRGLAGDDTLDGGDGVDTVDYSFDAGIPSYAGGLLASGGGLAGVTVDLANHTATDGYGTTDTLSNFENVVGTNGGDTLIGDGGSNFLNGIGGNDILQGGDGIDTLLGVAGNDQLYGQAADDTLIGGTGADLLDGGDGFDWANYSSAGGSITASLENPGSNAGEAAGDTYVGVEALFGSNFADTLYGDSANNSFNGGLGNDSVFARDGADFLDGNGGNDQLYGEAGDDFLTGGDNDDMLVGGGDNDQMHGGNGNDTLDGGLGFNQLYGEAGNDAFVFNQQGYDGIIDFASGQDKLDLRLLGVTFDDLDTNDNFVLDDGDVSAQLTVSTFGGSLQLWHQGNSSVGVSLVGVASLQESDLLLS